MPRFAYHLVDVFVPERRGEAPWEPAGNPLAVFTDARGLDDTRMQHIAFELNLSETTFVLPAERDDCDVRVRIFTPRAEIPMAGHPTVGTAFVLDRGDRIVFEEGVGPVPVERVRTRDGATRWRMTQPRPRFGARCDDRDVLAAALGLDAADLVADLPCETVATGPPFLIVPLRSLEALSRARLRIDAWEPIERALDGVQPYLFAQTGSHSARTRLFAASFGIAEDPATGGAAGPLGAYWMAHRLATPPGDGALHLAVTQGVEMGRPSELFVEVDGTPAAIPAVHVAGSCKSIGAGWLDL